MQTLTIADSTGQLVAYRVRLMEGTPEGMGDLYVLLGDDGKVHPAAIALTDESGKRFISFDCIEVRGTVAYGYVWITRERSGHIGRIVSIR